MDGVGGNLVVAGAYEFCRQMDWDLVALKYVLDMLHLGTLFRHELQSQVETLLNSTTTK